MVAWNIKSNLPCFWYSMILSQISSIWFVLALSVTRLGSLFSFLYMILFVFLYFLRSSIFFSISCVTHVFLADFSNFPTLCFNVSSNISFTFSYSLSASASSLSPLPSVFSLRNLISISLLTPLLLFLKFSKFHLSFFPTVLRMFFSFVCISDANML
uniref:Putative product n=1 Tax=Xenopsylla cheopis TaxID=163159 RepID=A0A6M2DZU2_XENCH